MQGSIKLNSMEVGHTVEQIITEQEGNGLELPGILWM
jgi:hypothetical protein